MNSFYWMLLGYIAFAVIMFLMALHCIRYDDHDNSDEGNSTVIKSI